MLRRLADNRTSSSLAARLRRRRFAFFLSLLSKVPRPVRILDIGGTQRYWQVVGFPETEGIHVTLLNLHLEPVSSAAFDSITGDARSVPGLADKSFDVVYSNSVIEHVGSFHEQRQMAEEVKRIGLRYFIQTPNRYFPIEPHFLVPGFQFLPLETRAWLSSRLQLGWMPKFEDRTEAREQAASISLLTRQQLRMLFPEASLYTEHFLGLPKSYVAYHGWS